MRRFPWEIKLTPEEEQEVLAKAVKYKPRLVISRWIARVISAAFFIWFISGLFSVYFAVPFSLSNIFKLSVVCFIPHQFCVAFAREQRGRITGFEKLDRNNEIAMLNRRILIESVSFLLLHLAIGLVANFQRL